MVMMLVWCWLKVKWYADKQILLFSNIYVLNSSLSNIQTLKIFNISNQALIL